MCCVLQGSKLSEVDKSQFAFVANQATLLDKDSDDTNEGFETAPSTIEATPPHPTHNAEATADNTTVPPVTLEATRKPIVKLEPRVKLSRVRGPLPTKSSPKQLGINYGASTSSAVSPAKSQGSSPIIIGKKIKLSLFKETGKVPAATPSGSGPGTTQVEQQPSSDEAKNTVEVEFESIDSDESVCVPHLRKRLKLV